MAKHTIFMPPLLTTCMAYESAIISILLPIHVTGNLKCAGAVYLSFKATRATLSIVTDLACEGNVVMFNWTEISAALPLFFFFFSKLHRTAFFPSLPPQIQSIYYFSLVGHISPHGEEEEKTKLAAHCLDHIWQEALWQTENAALIKTHLNRRGWHLRIVGVGEKVLTPRCLRLRQMDGFRRKVMARINALLRRQTRIVQHPGQRHKRPALFRSLTVRGAESRSE